MKAKDFFLMNKVRIAIIGAGASGCFCAVNIKEELPFSDIYVFERQDKPMQKLLLTGGGRCNITNTFENIKSFATIYPRSNKLMRSLFYKFNNEDLIRWFENKGLKLYAQEDKRVFPVSNSSKEVADTLYREMIHNGVKIITNTTVRKIEKENEKFILTTEDKDCKKWEFDKVVVCSGSFTENLSGKMLSPLSLNIVQPVASLFSFNVDNNWCKKLMGLSVENVSLKIAGTKFKSSGSLLFTHCGISGPVVLKLSSFAARFLYEKNYQTKILINWCNDKTDEQIRDIILNIANIHSQKLVTNYRIENISSKHWEYFLEKANIPFTFRWSSLTPKHINRLVSLLSCDVYDVVGKSNFKEEFVTCGGVDIKNIDVESLESKQHKGLFFAGEVLDIDAITGGFNLQAAWTTAFVVAKSIIEKEKI